MIRSALLTSLLLLVASCGGDSSETATAPSLPSETATARPEATEAVAPTATSIPAPSVTPGTTAALVSVDPDQPLETFASYLYDTTRETLWRVEVGGIQKWSPDASALASARCCAGGGFIAILDIDANRSVRIADGEVTHMEWSADSGSLAYSITEPGERAGLYVSERDGTQNRLVSAMAGIGEIRWLSPELLAIGVGDGPNPRDLERFFRVEVNSGNLSELKVGVAPGEDDPRIIFGEPSSSGEWIAFEDGGSTYVWNSGSGETRQISEEEAVVIWASQGESLLLATFSEGEPIPQWRLIDLEAGTSRELPDVGFGAQWLADGVRFAHLGYRCHGGVVWPAVIFVVNAIDGAAHALTSTPQQLEWHFLISPRQDVAVFEEVNQAQDERSLKLIDLTSGQVDELVAAGIADGAIRPGSWSPDGRYLTFALSGGIGVCD